MLRLLNLLVLTGAITSLGVASAQNASVAYTPITSPCPPNFNLTRSVSTNSSLQTLHPSELAYIAARQKDVLPGAWKSYLANVQSSLASGNSSDSLPSYLVDILSGNATSSSTSGSNTSEYPIFGIATSGGGYRAAIFGAGVLNVLDGRNDSSVKTGTGGLLQAATYLAGLSGGAWLVTSFVQADLPSIQDLVFGPSSPTANEYAGWNTAMDILAPGNSTTADLAYILGLVGEVKGKYEAGWPISVNDVWARGLGHHFLNATGAGGLFSDLDQV